MPTNFEFIRPHEIAGQARNDEIDQSHNDEMDQSHNKNHCHPE